jgi:hypothetical protein
MDTGDLLGGLSNLCLVAAVRRVPTPVTLDGVRLFLEQTFAADIRRFSIALASYTALPFDEIVEAVERLIPPESRTGTK